jgi:hypothetical protein
MPELFFENTKTGKKYKVLKFDREAGKVRLVGEHNVEFEEKFDKELFQKLGYELKQA